MPYIFSQETLNGWLCESDAPVKIYTAHPSKTLIYQRFLEP